MSLVVGARASLASTLNGHGNSAHPPTPPPANRLTCRLVASPDGKRNTIASCVCDQSTTTAASATATTTTTSSSASSSSSFSSICKEAVSHARRRRHQRMVPFSVTHPFSGIQEEEEEGEEGEDEEEKVMEEGLIIEPGIDLSSIREWELDFCSRPILDERGKRLWELLICDCGKSFQFAKFYPNNVINSITLKEALMLVIQSGLPKPQKIRFFRSQMQNIVSKACTELDIQAVPSRRCISIMRWMDERYDSVYSQHPGFQENAAPLLQLEQAFPLELPDNLRGEQWAFVQLPLSGVIEEVSAVENGDSFGSYFPLEVLGLDLPSNAIIPGVAVASSRATPLAAWTNALELASIQIDRQKKCLVLSTGVSDRWLYAYYRKSRQADQEAAAWEASKKACGGLHFLAVQKSLDSDICAGFWLLYDGPPSRV